MIESFENGLNREDIGLRIRAIRGERSQKEFAKITGATQSYISDLERGKCFPSVTFLARLSELSGRSYDWILTGKEEREVPVEPDKPVEPVEPVEPVRPVEPIREEVAPPVSIPSEVD
jgi:transcriptional regulator with XRE-family HTH domain